MQKDYNKHETNWTKDDWKNATVVTWKTPIQDFSSAEEVSNYLTYYIQRKRDENTGMVGASYREVWQKDNHHYIIVSWFIGKKVSYMAEQYEKAEPLLAKEGFFLEVLKYGHGKNYTEEAVCFKDCVRLLETIDGNLVAVNEARRALGVIQANNGYALKDDVDDDNIDDDDNDDDDVPEAAE